MGARMLAWTALAVVATGCSGSMGTLATAIVEPPAFPTRVVGPVEGRDCVGLVLSTVGRAPSVERAVRQALAQAPGADAIANARLTSERGGVPPLWLRDCLVVRGDAVRVRAGS